MKTISLEEMLANQDKFIAEAKAGKIFVYPTDTIYGIGSIYTPENVEKIFSIKKRDQQKMFSIIAPNFARIQKEFSHADIPLLQKHLETYHGVTYIFNYGIPGIRIIKHPFQNFVEALGEPFITTSCNISGEPIVTNIQELPKEIADHVDYIIDGGILGGKPSVLIDLVADKIIER